MDTQIRIQEQAQQVAAQWEQDERWAGIQRTYTSEEVVRLRGSVTPEQTLAFVDNEQQTWGPLLQKVSKQ